MYRDVTQLQLPREASVCKNEIWQCVWFNFMGKASFVQCMNSQLCMRTPTGLGLKMGCRVRREKPVQEAKVRQFAGMAVSRGTIGR